MSCNWTFWSVWLRWQKAGIKRWSVAYTFSVQKSPFPVSCIVSIAVDTGRMVLYTPLSSMFHTVQQTSSNGSGHIYPSWPEEAQDFLRHSLRKSGKRSHRWAFLDHCCWRAFSGPQLSARQEGVTVVPMVSRKAILPWQPWAASVDNLAGSC